MMEVMADNPTKLGTKLRTLVNESGLSQTEIAARIGGISAQQFGKYMHETEPSMPSPGPLMRIARFFNVSIEWLIGDEYDLGDPRMPFLAFTASQLVAEIERRAETLIDRLDRLVEIADGLDWEDYAKEIDKDVQKWINPQSRQTALREDKIGLAVDLARALSVLPSTPIGKIVRFSFKPKTMMDHDYWINRILLRLKSNTSSTFVFELSMDGYTFDPDTHIDRIETLAKRLVELTDDPWVHSEAIPTDTSNLSCWDLLYIGVRFQCKEGMPAPIKPGFENHPQVIEAKKKLKRKAQ